VGGVQEGESKEDSVTPDTLLSLPLGVLTAERIGELEADRQALEAQRAGLAAQTPQELWDADLAAFLDQWERSEAVAAGAAAAARKVRPAAADDSAGDEQPPKAKGRSKATKKKIN